MTGPGEEKVHDSPIGWVKGHAKVYAATNGKVGHVVRGMPNLLLTTRGRRSGLLRRTPLVYAADGDDYVLIASNGGAERDPQWYLNLVADPNVTVQIGREVFRASATTVTAEEFASSWSLILEIMPWCADYRTRRQIPLVRLTPLPREDPPGGAIGEEAEGQ